MSLDPQTVLAILAMALATYLTRVGGLWLLRLANVQGRMRAALDAERRASAHDELKRWLAGQHHNNNPFRAAEAA